jgi:hypothetical protein
MQNYGGYDHVDVFSVAQPERPQFWHVLEVLYDV